MGELYTGTPPSSSEPDDELSSSNCGTTSAALLSLFVYVVGETTTASQVIMHNRSTSAQCCARRTCMLSGRRSVTSMNFLPSASVCICVLSTSIVGLYGGLAVAGNTGALGFLSILLVEPRNK